jgi:phosphatidylinositol-4,5-bisphosphate 3-kinase
MRYSISILSVMNSAINIFVFLIQPHHYSALAAFLMRRALYNPFEIGHAFFWHLQAEMHVPEISERYGILLEMYLTGCGEQRNVFLRQRQVLSCLEGVSEALKKVTQL